MFTDQPVTPVRLEVLLNVLERYSSGLKREVVYELLQPSPLLGGKPIAAKETIKAAQDLGLVVESSKVIKLDSDYDKKKSAKDNILRGMDKNVLSNSNLELYLSLFYSFYLGLNKEVYQCSKFDRERWVDEFNEKVFK